MDEEFKLEVVQRLASLEGAVNNHIPGQLSDLRSRLRAVDSRLWAVLVLTLGALLGAWVN